MQLLGGQQYSIYINTVGATTSYTDIAAGGVTYSNADLTVQLGSSGCGKFTSTVNANRGFNGSIIYTSGCAGTRQPVVANIDGGCSFPVSLLNFKGYKQAAINTLEWTTTTEQNNSGFELQRSTNSVNFNALSFIATKATNGNSTTSLAYNFNDLKPIIGKGWYRLKQIDKNGNSSISPTVLINREAKSGIISGIYPNPAKQEINLDINTGSNQMVRLLITDLSGKTIMNLPVANGSYVKKVAIESLSVGTYLVKAICNNGCNGVVHKFVKQ